MARDDFKYAVSELYQEVVGLQTCANRSTVARLLPSVALYKLPSHRGRAAIEKACSNAPDAETKEALGELDVVLQRNVTLLALSRARSLAAGLRESAGCTSLTQLPADLLGKMMTPHTQRSLTRKHVPTATELDELAWAAPDRETVVRVLRRYSEQSEHPVAASANWGRLEYCLKAYEWGRANGDDFALLAWARANNRPRAEHRLPQRQWGCCTDLYPWPSAAELDVAAVSFPSGVTSIGPAAFWLCTSLTKVELCDSVKYIGRLAFGGCTHLTEVAFPPSGEYVVGPAAFRECASLESVDLTGQAQLHDEGGAFSACRNLRYLRLPESVSRVACSTCAQCHRLAQVHWPSEITHVGPSAFASTALEEAAFPRSLVCIEHRAFHRCRSLRELTWPHSDAAEPELGAEAFAGCTLLAHVQLPDSLRRVARGAFGGCGALESLTWPSRLNEIHEDAFWSTALTALSLPDAIILIGDGAFADCNALSHVQLGNAPIHIAEGAFRECRALRSVRFGRSAVTVAEGAFRECRALSSVEFVGRARVEEGAFRECNLSAVALSADSTAAPRAFDSNVIVRYAPL